MTLCEEITLDDDREVILRVSVETRSVGGYANVSDVVLDGATITDDEGSVWDWTDGEAIQIHLRNELEDACNELLQELNEDSSRLDSLLEDDHFGN